MSGHSSNDSKRVDQAIESFVERFRRGERPSIDEYVAQASRYRG